jgi:prepilin-type N-terminal cleavage/methylation domain-containing protein
MNARGFTLVEMVVCIAIFAMMTALLVAKYGNFNQSVLLTDLAYDTAITVRTAQTYGLGVQSSNMGVSTSFKYAYGVEFCANATAGGCGSVSNGGPTINLYNNLLVLFADANNDGIYDSTPSPTDLQESLYTITRGAVVSGFCFTDGCATPTTGYNRLDVTFKRPNPDAVICANGSCSPTYPYAAIFIKGTDGNTRQVIIRNTGQVSVQE